MTLEKFDKMREQIQREMEEKLARIEEDEAKERERRIAPLVSKYTSLVEEVSKRAISRKVESLGGVKFKKADIKKRFEKIFEDEIDILIMESLKERESNTIEGMDKALSDGGGSPSTAVSEKGSGKKAGKQEMGLSEDSDIDGNK